jgi:hypothetical protein
MPAFISRKRSFGILLSSLCAAAAAALGLNYLLAGPRLAGHYDALMKRRPLPPVSREILLINTNDMLESGDVLTALKVLCEFDAAALLVEAPVLGSSSVRIGNEEEIHRRFTDEYALLGKNIRNLFEAIRLGSVSPGESSRYVENLVELAERGRDRLSAAILSRDGAGAVQTARAAAVFGNVLEAADLRSSSQALAGEPPEIPWYARPRPDRDGKLRRIAPLLRANGTGGGALVEHIAYSALKSRWDSSRIEYREQGPVLLITKQGGEETCIPLDRDGNILVEKAREGQFRRIGLEFFHEYENADRALGQLLKDAEALGVYAAARPEGIPLFLYDYARGLWEELLKAGDGENAGLEEKRGAWIAAREDYVKSLEELLGGNAEAALVQGYEEIIATETLKDEGLEKLKKLRDDLIAAFAELREKHLEFAALRNSLAEALADSFCVMGPDIPGAQAEASALLANSLLTGSGVSAAGGFYALLWSLGAAFLVLICIHRMRPAAVLIFGIFGGLLCFAGFGWSFIISACWMDPLVSAGSCLAGTMLIFFCRFAAIRRGARRFRLAYGPALGKPVLKQLIRAGRPLLSETVSARAAVIAVKDPSLPGKEDREKPLDAAKAAAEFRGAVMPVFKKAGAVIVGCEGDTIIAAFGSPPERIYIGRTRTETPYGDDPGARSSHHPAIKASGFISELLQQNGGPANNWRFGMDCGDCAFSWSAETGYTANGRPVVRSRILASLSSRYKAKILITDSFREKLNQPARKLGTFGQAGSSENFYELPMT